MSKKGGRGGKSPEEKMKGEEPECCAVVVLKAGEKDKTVLPLKVEDGDMRIGDKTLKVKCECD